MDLCYDWWTQITASSYERRDGLKLWYHRTNSSWRYKTSDNGWGEVEAEWGVALTFNEAMEWIEINIPYPLSRATLITLL